MHPEEMVVLARRIVNHENRRGRIPAVVLLEDVQQAILLAGLRALPRHDPASGASAKTYVGARMSGAVADEVDRHMRLHLDASVEEMEEAHVLPGHTETPDKIAIHYERATKLNRAIDRLPERWRHVLELYYREAMSLREIGERLGVTEVRACQLHKQAVKRLKEQLCEERRHVSSVG